MKNMMVNGFQVTAEHVERALSELRLRDEFSKTDMTAALERAGVPALHTPQDRLGAGLRANACSSMAAARVLTMNRERQIIKHVGKGIWHWA